MTADQQQIEAIRTQCLANLAEVRANPKPSYTLGDQTVRWEEHVVSLQRTIDWCDRKLLELTPFEFRTTGRGT